MNRTFGAFGILLSLLVLATLGVSSSSRSTQVRVIPTKTTEKQARRCGGGTFVIVLPERASGGEPHSIATVQIEAANESGGLDLDPVDCRISGGGAFDYTVYGDPAQATTADGRKAPAVEPHAALNAEELVGIFNTLETSGRRNGSYRSSFHDWLVDSARPYLLGFKNWAIRKLENLPLSWMVTSITNRQLPLVPSVTWADYSFFADHVVRIPPCPQPARVERAADDHVQSGHWLLHSAASSLNHLALVLQAAADRLEQPAELANAN